MATDLPLLCACGTLRGAIRNVSPKNGHRMTCYCDDCQAFAAFLGRDDITNANGGTDIFQMAPGRVKITSDKSLVAGVRLRADGMHRWYCRECKTPLGNTVGPGMPFIGLVTRIIDSSVSESEKDAAMGPRRVHAMTSFARGVLPRDVREASKLKAFAKAGVFLSKWVLQGVGKPSPVFSEPSGAPYGELRVLTDAERVPLYVR